MGWEFLSRFGEFHEVPTGKHWQKEVARKYFFEAFAGPPAVPQVILVTREGVLDDDGGFQYLGERVEQRHRGLSDLLGWSELLAKSSSEVGERL